MFCYKCGKKLLDGAMFCAFCGSKVIIQDEKEDDTETIDDAAEEVMEKKVLIDINTNSDAIAEDEFNRDHVDEKECDDDDNFNADEETSKKNNTYKYSNAELYNIKDSDKLWTVFHNSKDRNVELIIGGENFSIAGSMHDVVMIKEAFDQYTISAIRKFVDFYNDNDIAGVVSSGDKIGCSLLMGAAELSLKYYGERGLYSVTASSVLQWNGGDNTSYRTHSKSSLGIWREGFNRIERIFNKINEDADTEKEYRESRKENRTKLQATGFGLSGYISGSMKAGAYNMVTGAGHSIVNAVQNAMTDSERTDKLNELYFDKDTLFSLKRSIFLAINQIKMDTIAICGFEHFYNQKGIDKCRIVLDNINNNTVPESKQKKVLLSLFLQDPFNTDVYRLYLEKYGDEDYGLSLMARLFGLESTVHSAKKDLLIKRIKESNVIVNKNFIVSILDTDTDKEADITYPEMMQRDCETLREIYRNLLISEDEGMRHLTFVAKNVAADASKELSSEILEEFLINRFGYVEDITNINFKEVKLKELSQIYHFSFDSIADGCFASVNIEKLSFEGVKINTLCRGAFRDATIKAIDVLDMENIPDEAFEGCKYLKKVDFLTGTISIGNKAFWRCDRLKLVVIPKTVTTLPKELTDNKNVVFENYDRETYSYKYCVENNVSCKISRGAELYEHGCNFKRNNIIEAYKYFLGASEEKYEKAFFELGNCYYNGTGTAVNYEKALKYFELAASETENPLSYHMLGYMYLEGQGTVSQTFKAVRRFVKAAEFGVSWSMNMLGTIYLNGRGGIVNVSEAAKWFKKGADLGDNVAGENYQEILRNNPGIVIASDSGEQDYDIRKIAQNMLPAFADEMFKEFEKKEGGGFYYYGTTQKAGKKFGNAIEAYAPLVKSEVPLVCYDDTYFGNADDGCILTNYGIYVHNSGEKNMHLIYKFIKDMSYNDEYVFINRKSNVTETQKMKIKVGTPKKLDSIIRYIKFYMQ